ncbi:MAG: metal ABC transporter substrate-binding protein [Nitriliruptoraceae bacterium]
MTSRRTPRVSAGRRPLAGLLLVPALLLAACGTDRPDPSDQTRAPTVEADGSPVDAEAPLLIVATTSILGDIVQNLVGADATVQVIMPPGADPHSFQPSPEDGVALREADLVVANGLDLEESLVDMLEAAAVDGANLFELGDALDPIEFQLERPDDHEHDDDDHGPYDPHVWFDPIRMADGVHLLATQIAAVDTRLGVAEWEARGDAYAAEILEVHAELEEMFATIPPERRILVTNHDALGYLAHRYAFEVLGTVIPGASTQAETDPRSFSALIEAVEQAQVPAVFAENTDSTRLAEQLASEVIGRGDLQVEVVRIPTDALGESGSGAETYLGLLRTTAGLIVDALA